MKKPGAALPELFGIVLAGGIGGGLIYLGIRTYTFAAPKMVRKSEVDGTIKELLAQSTSSGTEAVFRELSMVSIKQLTEYFLREEHPGAEHKEVIPGKTTYGDLHRANQAKRRAIEGVEVINNALKTVFATYEKNGELLGNLGHITKGTASLDPPLDSKFDPSREIFMSERFLQSVLDEWRSQAVASARGTRVAMFGAGGLMLFVCYGIAFGMSAEEYDAYLKQQQAQR